MTLSDEWLKDWLRYIRKVEVVQVKVTGTPVYANKRQGKEVK